MDWSRAEIWSRQLWVQVGDNNSLGYKLGAENKRDIKQRKREGVPRGSTRLDQLSSRVPRGNLSLVHVSKWAPPWYKSLTGGPHLSATWQSTSGPPHLSICHMAQSQQATSTCLCHMAQPEEATSTQLCHMAVLYSATSAILTGH
jgi:hypothetical protein